MPIALFVLNFSRITPQAIEIALINWAGEKGIPFVMAGTKADKAGKKQAAETSGNYKVALSEIWEELYPPFTSAAAKPKKASLKFLGLLRTVWVNSGEDTFYWRAAKITQRNFIKMTE